MSRRYTNALCRRAAAIMTWAPKLAQVRSADYGAICGQTSNLKDWTW